ncbi:TolC family protein [Pseudomonas sp. LB3P14]
MKKSHQFRSPPDRVVAGPFARFFNVRCAWPATALLSVQLYSMTVRAELLEFTRVPEVAEQVQVATMPSASPNTVEQAAELTFSKVEGVSEVTPVKAVADEPIPSAISLTPQLVARSAGAPEPVAAPVVAPVAEPALPGVSVLATRALSSQRVGRSGKVLGASETELRAMFHRAVQAAAEHSPQVQRAQADFEAAQADIDEAKGQRLPQIDLGTQTKAARFGSGSDNDSRGSGGINLNVSTPIYDWGRIRKTIDSRKYLSDAASSNIEAERESLAYEVTTNMVELGKQRMIIDISQEYVQRMDELVKMLAGIVAVDRGRVSELTQAKARLLQAQASLDSAESRARDAEINLRKRIGERPVMIPHSAEWNIHPANLDVLLTKVGDHPTIHQGKAQTQSAEMQAEVVRASSLPQLNWVISKTTADDALGREQPWQTTLSVSWAAFRGGSTRASERAALQRAEASRQRTEEQRLDLEYRIRTADHDARTLLERAELYRDLTVESERIRLAFYEQWYHLGKRTLLDVLIAESDHYGNRVGEVTQRFDGYQAILRQYAGAGSLAVWLQGSGQ